jgi:hypothetical protein
MLRYGDAVTMSRRLALSIATTDAANLKAVAGAGAAARDAGFDDKTLADWNLPDAKSGARTRRTTRSRASSERARSGGRVPAAAPQPAVDDAPPRPQQ